MKLTRRTGFLVPIALLAFGLSLPAHAQIPGWDVKSVDQDQGSAAVDANGVWTVKGFGGDTWGRSDHFTIVYKPLKGDGSVTTKLLSAEDASEWQKVGVMMREDLDRTAPPMITVEKAGGTHGGESIIRGIDGGFGSKDRKMTGPNANDDQLFPDTLLPVWLKLERRGDRFTPYASADGALWIPVHRAQRIKMKDEIAAGVWLTGNSADALSATFDGKISDVSAKLLKPEEAVPVQPNPVIALGGDNKVLLMWDRVNHLGQEADGYVVYKAKAGADLLDDASFTKIKELPGDQPSFLDETIKNGEIAHYRVTTVVKVGPDRNKIVESRRFGNRLYFVTGAPNPPIKIGDRDYFANVLDGGANLEVTAKPGSAKIDGSGVVTMSASGVGIPTGGGYSDGGEQLLTPVTGDFTFTAQIPAAPTGGGEPKFGIAVRESTLAESAYVGLLIGADNVINAQRRPFTNSEEADDLTPASDTTATFPIYLRIQRRGDEVKMLRSADGKTFTEYGNPATTTLPGLPANVYVGFVGTSGDNAATAEGRFAQVTLITP
jgi:hypothetical protein